MICLNCKKPYIGNHSAFCNECCDKLPMILTDLKIERDKAQAAVARLRELPDTVCIGKYTLSARGKTAIIECVMKQKILKLSEPVHWTISGEGPTAGKGIWIVRLSGCNRNCPHCDQPEKGKIIELPLDEIVKQIPQYDSVMLTGGEPLLQLDMTDVWVFLNNGNDVQIETNGTLPLKAEYPVHGVTLVISPKHTPLMMSGFGTDPRKFLTCLKFLVKDDDLVTPPERDYGIISKAEHILTWLTLFPWMKYCPVYIQPLWELNRCYRQANVRQAIKIVRDLDLKWDSEVRLSVQIHKFIGVP